MDLHLTCEARDHVRVFVNGALVCEVAVQACLTRDTLAQEVQQARALQALASLVRRLGELLQEAGDKPDHNFRTPAAKTEAYVRGLRDGMAGTVVPHPSHPFVPPIPPESTPTYERGFRQGAALAWCLQYAGAQEKA